MEPPKEPLTYGAYLRVPELLSLQSPLGSPPVHDEMLFIVLQQAQELWFKQALHELKAVVALLGRREILEAARLLSRVHRIMGVLSHELEVMETLVPAEFHRFRHVLTPSSGFESQQFRELELASGLQDPHFLRLVSQILDLDAVRSRWPKTLGDAWTEVVQAVDQDPVAAAVEIYCAPARYPEEYALLEALSEYELRFHAWRFHHIQVVERAIGDRSPGTGGSAGTSYLSKTLAHRFFPELWEARNRITAAATNAPHGS